MNRPDLLGPCLDGIRSQTRVSYEILVVAYMFSGENMQWLRENYPEVRIVLSDKLRGFAENNNLALPLARGRFCFVVNDDTLMSMPVIDALLSDFSSLGDDVAAVSPKIVFADGRIQTLGRSEVSPWTYVRHYLHLVDEAKPGPGRMGTGLFETYNLNGACFLVRTDVFRKAGWFDETYTFTPEDIALGSFLRQRGYRLYADSRVSITHLANSTASRMETAIKPTRVRGALIFYSSLGHLSNPQKKPYNKLIYCLLAVFVLIVETLRGMKYMRRGVHYGFGSRDQIMVTTARNVRRTVFSSRTSGEIFRKLYSEIDRK